MRLKSVKLKLPDYEKYLILDNKKFKLKFIDFKIQNFIKFLEKFIFENFEDIEKLNLKEFKKILFEILSNLENHSIFKNNID